MKGREHFGSRMAYVLALTGSAVGLGNIWRFPYLMGEYGGAAFLIIYVAFAVFISLPIMLCESVIGRRARSGTYYAMRDLAPGSKWWILGLVSVFTSFIIASYYSVVGGWSVDYMFRSIFTGFQNLTPDLAASTSAQVFSSTWEPIAYHTLFIGVSSLIVYFGVKRGIEKFSKITMPLLFLLMIAIMAYSFSLPGAGAGIEYLIRPDWSKVNASMLAAALGQSFFSMSLGLGAVLIYSSYAKKSDNLLTSAGLTVLFDVGFALIAGFAIMSAVFACGAHPDSGPTLVFETLPYIFSQMSLTSPVIGRTVAICFFVAVVMAALSSEISMIEVSVSHFIEKRRMSRPAASLLVFAGAWAIGVLCCLSFSSLSWLKLFKLTVFEFLNVLSSDFLMTLGALAFSIFVGWVMDRKAIRGELTNDGTCRFNKIMFKPIYFTVKYVAPIMIVVIFITNLLSK